MKIPHWYLWQFVVWLVTGLPFQWVFTAFNGVSFFSLPDLPGTNGPSVPAWVLAMIFLYHPVLSAPVAVWSILTRCKRPKTTPTAPAGWSRWTQFPAMLRGLLLAIAAGTAFPVIFLSIGILGSSFSSSDVSSAIGIALFTLAVSFIIVSSSTILFGLPLTKLFKRLGCEGEAVYLLSGGVLGFLVPGTIFAVVGGSMEAFFHAFPLGVLGTISGALTGRTWWRQYRAANVDPPT